MSSSHSGGYNVLDEAQFDESEESSDDEPPRLQMPRPPGGDTPGSSRLQMQLSRAWKHLKRRESLEVLLLVSVYVFSAVVNILSYKKVFDEFGQENSFFLLQANNICYIVMSGIVAHVRIKQGKITPKMRSTPLKIFLTMGFLDGMSTFLASAGASYTAGQIQTILNLTSIPITMVSTVFYLARKYLTIQYAGAFIILAGSVLTVVPQIVDPNSNTPMRAASVFLFALSLFPQSFSTVYKESRLQEAFDTASGPKSSESEPIYGVTASPALPGYGATRGASSIPIAVSQDIGKLSIGVPTMAGSPVGSPGGSHPKEDEPIVLDVFYLTYRVSFIQFMLSFIYTPLLAIPAFGGVSLKDMPHQMQSGWNCLTGAAVPTADAPCHHAFWPFIVYSLVNIAYNVLSLFVVKRASATMVAIASAVTLPVSNICFTFRFLLGSSAESFTIWDILGLIVVLSGFLMYAIPGAREEDSKEELVVQKTADALSKRRKARLESRA